MNENEYYEMPFITGVSLNEEEKANVNQFIRILDAGSL
jgi:hypothetical protein